MKRDDGGVIKDQRFDYALSQNRRSWLEALREDPEKARLELAIARIERTLVESENSSPVWAQARREWWTFRDSLTALLAKRFPKGPKGHKA